MKKHLIALLFLCPLLSQAQKEDFNWIMGYNFNNSPGTENIIMNFSAGNARFEYRNMEMAFSGYSSCISDENGDLILYSNGCRISNSAPQTVQGAEFLNELYDHDFRCDEDFYGNAFCGSLMIPDVASPQQVHVIYEGYKINFQTLTVIGSALHYATIDFKESELGKCTAVDVPIITDTLSGGSVQAVRHANGRDWWIITPLQKSNHYYINQLSPSGFSPEKSQHIGQPTTYSTVSSQVAFTPDGSKYIRFNVQDGLFIFDFDRCEGILSNFRHIDIQDSAHTLLGGLAVSPNSRYLYLTNSYDVHQFDLQADDIGASHQTVAHQDGFIWGGPVGFGAAQLAPDGKIYVSSGNGNQPIHILHNPDEPGLACRVQQHAMLLKYAYWTFPNMPNYRLGPVDGSVCDSLGINNLPWCWWRAEADSSQAGTATFRDLSAYEPTAWLWDFGDGTTSTERHPKHTYSAPGEYTVCLTVSNSNGTDSLCRIVKVLAVGTLEPYTPEVIAMPNPTSAHWLLLLARPLERDALLEIYDVTGRSMAYHQSLSSGMLTVETDLSHLMPGMYFWAIRAQKQVLATGRVVKQ